MSEHRHCWGINLKCLECDEYYPSYEGQQQRILAEKDRRIAELEAEVASLKDPYRIFTEWQKDQLRKLEEIKQQSATDFEEGEG